MTQDNTEADGHRPDSSRSPPRPCPGTVRFPACAGNNAATLEPSRSLFLPHECDVIPTIVDDYKRSINGAISGASAGGMASPRKSRGRSHLSAWPSSGRTIPSQVRQT
jgi:hypothetical protein